MSETGEPAPITVEVWSDVVCPWCYIGKRRFEAALDRFDRAPVQIRYQAFMLDPTAPEEPSPVREVYEKKFGGPDQAQEILDRVTAEAAGEGLEFQMDIAKRANTLSAHRLLVLGEREGVQLALKDRLMQAYFSEGEDIADHGVLAKLGAEVGLDADAAASWLAEDQGRQEVADALLFAANNNITGVPGYVFNRSMLVPGAQSPETFLSVLEQVAEPSA